MLDFRALARPGSGVAMGRAVRTKMRILTLLVRHGTAKYADALDDIQGLFARQLPDVVHECVVIDNSLPPEHVTELQPGVRLIGSSNASWEFSAWDSGVAHLGDRLMDYDFVHLATSAFRQLYVKYLDRFDSRMLGSIKGRAAAVGHIDYYNAPVTLLGCRCQAWLRTSFVMLPPVEVKLLGSLTSVRRGLPFFSGRAEAPFLDVAPVSEGYRQNILGWLTGDGTDQGTEWHSRFKLDSDTLPFFESKTLAIFNEQMLSNRLRAQGCAIVDATWLATQSSRAVAQAIDAFPSWRGQVTQRDDDAAPASLLA